MPWDGINQRGEKAGRRETDHVCPFAPNNCRDILMTKSEGESMKRIFKITILSAITVAIAVAGYFAHSQDKAIDLLLKQNEAISELKVETIAISIRQDHIIEDLKKDKDHW